MAIAENTNQGFKSWQGTDTTPIGVLEEVREKGRVWEDLAAQYHTRPMNPMA